MSEPRLRSPETGYAGVVKWSEGSEILGPAVDTSKLSDHSTQPTTSGVTVASGHDWADVDPAGTLIATATVRISAEPHYLAKAPFSVGLVELSTAPRSCAS